MCASLFQSVSTMATPDPVTHPLQVIDALFQQAVAAAGGNMPGEDFGVEGHFKSIITDANIGNVSSRRACVSLPRVRHLSDAERLRRSHC